MEKDRDQKHMCKFCSKSFPCGRSLGGHMRSHLINIPSTDRTKPDEKAPKKKLPPLANGFSMDGGDQFNLRENPKTDTSLPEKACKECGKSFQSWKALFGHMKCHSVNNGRATSKPEEDSWISSDDPHKPIADSQSDTEAATPFCRRKRSDRPKKRFTSLNPSQPSVSEVDQQEQEEVALSLIILSRDKRNYCGGTDSVADSSDNAPQLLEAERERKKSKSRKRRTVNGDPCPYDLQKRSKFACSICRKAFPSYQALGGHRASHKKFKGCCAPTNECSVELTENSNRMSEKEENIGCKKSKEHECPICFKAFASGQALGGHKRSHLMIIDQAKFEPLIEAEKEKKPVRQIRGFLDLNLPAPDEEESDEVKPWWIAEQPRLGLLSS